MMNQSGNNSEQKEESLEERSPTKLERRVYGLLFAIATLLGGFVALVTVVDFIDERKTKVILISAGILLVSLPLFYIGYFIYSGKDKRIGFVIASLVLITAVGGYSGGYGVKLGDQAGHKASYGSQNSSTGPGSLRSSTPSTRAESPVIPLSPGFSFNQPTDYSHVSGVFDVSGTTPDLNGDSLWLFDYSNSANGPQLVYYRDGSSAIPVDNGNWSTTDGPIGGPSDIGSTFTIALVLANARCSDIIANTKPNSDGDTIVGSKLPEGCSRVGIRHVIKSS